MNGISAIFGAVLDMAWAAVFVIPVVLVCRILLKPADRRWSYLLWGIVALRLMFPVMLPSEFGLFSYLDAAQARLGNITASQRAPDSRWEMEKENTGSETDARQDKKTVVGGEDAAAPAVPMTPDRDLQESGISWKLLVWLAGMVCMAGYGAVSCLLLRQKLKFATKSGERVYECENIDSPFVFGCVHPVVYLPYRLKEQERNWILMHERVHIRRRDDLVKGFAYILLCVYWFHPLVWVSYLLMSRDIEQSCDEQVLKGLNDAERKEYGRLLLQFASGKRRGVVSVLGFGENGIRGRIVHILHYKKKPVWSAILAAVFLAAVALLCLTDSGNGAGTKEAVEKGTEKAAVSEAAKELYEAANPYLGDAAANGRLYSVIGKYLGEPGAAEMELKTDREPYILTLHFKAEPDEELVWKQAVLLLALIGNCGEVDWDYPSKDGTVTWYVPLADANENLGAADIKVFGKSPELLEELLGALELSTPPSDNREVVYGAGDLEKIKQYLAALPSDYTGAAQEENVLLFDSYGSARDWTSWNAFYQKVKKDSMGWLLIAYPTVEGDLIYKYISYDGEAFYCVEDDSRDAFRGEGPEYTEGAFSHLLVETVLFKGEEHLAAVLNNDAGLSYEDYERDMQSSAALVGSEYPWHTLFLCKKEGLLGLYGEKEVF